jgi:hypothetical protein
VGSAFRRIEPAESRLPRRDELVPVEAPLLALGGVEWRRIEMLYTLAVILLIAWLLGVVGTYTIGAFVHVLLVLAIVLFIMGLVTGRRPVV